MRKKRLNRIYVFALIAIIFIAMYFAFSFFSSNMQGIFYSGANDAQCSYGEILSTTTTGYNNIPSQMIAGQTYTILIDVLNKGTSEWDSTLASNYYALGSMDTQFKFGVDEIKQVCPHTNIGDCIINKAAWTDLKLSTHIPGADGWYRFVFDVTAPTTIGTYPFKWQMVKYGSSSDAGWFGSICGKNIEVVEAPSDLIADYNFNSETVGQVPANWVSWVQDNKGTISVALDGSEKVLKVASNGGRTIIQSPKIGIESSKTYSLSNKLKLTKTTGDFYVQLYCYNPEGTTKIGAVTVHKYTASTSGFVEEDYEFTPSDSAVCGTSAGKIRIVYLWSNSAGNENGQALIDNIELREAQATPDLTFRGSVKTIPKVCNSGIEAKATDNTEIDSGTIELWSKETKTGFYVARDECQATENKVKWGCASLELGYGGSIDVVGDASSCTNVATNFKAVGLSDVLAQYKLGKGWLELCSENYDAMIHGYGESCLTGYVDAGWFNVTKGSGRRADGSVITGSKVKLCVKDKTKTLLKNVGDNCPSVQPVCSCQYKKDAQGNVIDVGADCEIVNTETQCNAKNANNLDVCEWKCTGVGGATCTDSDGGKDYYVKGETCVGQDCKEDFCVDNTRDMNLEEYYCQASDDRGSSGYLCPQGCQSGACIQIPGIPTGQICEADADKGISTKVSTGVRIKSSDGEIYYCNPVDLKYKKASALGRTCVSDYECESNVCVDGKCTSIREELREQTTLLQKIFCLIKSVVSSETYEDCLAGYIDNEDGNGDDTGGTGQSNCVYNDESGVLDVTCDGLNEAECKATNGCGWRGGGGTSDDDGDGGEGGDTGDDTGGTGQSNCVYNDESGVLDVTCDGLNEAECKATNGCGWRSVGGGGDGE